jgi:hypothetical protein
MERSSREISTSAAPETPLSQQGRSVSHDGCVNCDLEVDQLAEELSRDQVWARVQLQMKVALFCPEPRVPQMVPQPERGMV